MARILVADDERSICDAFRLLLEAEGHTALVASTGEEALLLVREQAPELAFVDVRMPGMSGLEVLKEIGRIAPELPVVVMTAYGTLETAAEALRNRRSTTSASRSTLPRSARCCAARCMQPAPASAITAVGEDDDADPRPRLVGQSAAMQGLFKLIVRLADNDLTVLVQGESGVGKELVARAIHDSGARAREPFVALNCAAIPEQLIESELFGHERGAFTDAKAQRVGRFEAAGAGTLFLDEISELPLHLQGTLLRVLQERSFERVGSVAPVPFRARLVCASNRDLAAAVAAGEFREDLYHRINTVALVVPPLRERLDDLPELVQALIRRANREAGTAIRSVEQAAIERLQDARVAGQRPGARARHQALGAVGSRRSADGARPQPRAGPGRCRLPPARRSSGSRTWWPRWGGGWSRPPGARRSPCPCTNSPWSVSSGRSCRRRSRRPGTTRSRRPACWA